MEILNFRNVRNLCEVSGHGLDSVWNGFIQIGFNEFIRREVEKFLKSIGFSSEVLQLQLHYDGKVKIKSTIKISAMAFVVEDCVNISVEASSKNGEISLSEEKPKDWQRQFIEKFGSEIVDEFTSLARLIEKSFEGGHDEINDAICVINNKQAFIIGERDSVVITRSK